jgi:hypothetical protein
MDDSAVQGAAVAGCVREAFGGGRYFLTRRMRRAGSIEPGSKSGRVELKAMAPTGGAALGEHAQVQRYRSKEKEYSYEVLFQGSPNRKETNDYGSHSNKLALKQNDLCQEDRKTGKVF